MRKGKDQVRSLYNQMLVTYLTVTLSMLLLTGVAVSLLLRSYAMRERKDAISRELTVVSQMYANLLTGIVSAESVDNELTLIARHYDGLIQIIDQTGVARSYASDPKWNEVNAVAYTDAERNAMLGSAGLFNKSGLQFSQEKKPFRTLSAVLPAESADGNAAYCVRFFTDISDMGVAMRTGYLEILLIILVAVLLSVVVVNYTTTRLTKPFLEINDTVQKYSKGDYNIRIPVGDSKEASQLATSFNAMADQLKDLEATRRSFVANVSHELRSPLTSIKGFLEAMQDGTIDRRDYDKYIDVVLSETRRMAAMVNDLLDLARIESGKTALRLEVFDINELIRRTLLTFEARIYEKSMEVDVKFAIEQCYVEADNTQIGQVLRNIIDNAIKYSPEHSRLRIATYALKREAYVSISDSGQGIPEEDVPHVFDRFYKVEKAHTPTHQSGTGLGLSIVKRIIDQHGQTITLKSARGKGSTFTFTLKRAPSPKRMQQDGGRRNG